MTDIPWMSEENAEVLTDPMYAAAAESKSDQSRILDKQ